MRGLGSVDAIFPNFEYLQRNSGKKFYLNLINRFLISIRSQNTFRTNINSLDFKKSPF